MFYHGILPSKFIQQAAIVFPNVLDHLLKLPENTTQKVSFRFEQVTYCVCVTFPHCL